MAKYGKAAAKSVKSAMHREKRGTLKSGKGRQGMEPLRAENRRSRSDFLKREKRAQRFREKNRVRLR